MDLIFYFAFGVLNVCLLFLFNYLYKRNTGVELNDKDELINIISCIISGHFGTMVFILLGLFLFGLWTKYYRKNKK